MLMLFALPASLIGMAHVEGWGRLRGWAWASALSDGGWTLPLGMATIFLPLAFFILHARVREVPAVLREVQAIRPLSAARRVWMLSGPTMGRSAALAACIVMVLIVQEVHATALLVAPGQETLAIRAMTLLHFAPDGLVAAICVLTLLAMAGGLASILLCFALVRSFWRRSVAYGVGD
jgi:iron(III) transport system permease protein